MLSTTLLIPLLCAVGTRAVLPAHPPADGDQCGPTIQDIAKGDPQDSCKTVPPMTGRTPIPFGIAVMYNKIPSPATTYSWHQQCDPVVTIICDTMKDANSTQNGVWYFQSGPESSSGRKFAACNMGFWIPNIDGGAGKPPQTADHDQCKAIFGAMVEAADANAMLTQSITTRKSFVIGSSVNLKQNPAKPPSPITLPGGVGTGGAVNAGYPSYVVAFDSDRQHTLEGTDTSVSPNTGCRVGDASPDCIGSFGEGFDK